MAPATRPMVSASRVTTSPPGPSATPTAATSATAPAPASSATRDDCPDDGNECTAAACTSNACSTSSVVDGTMCDDDMGVCDQGVCVPANLCEGVNCSDGNDCTQDSATPGPGICSNPNEPDGASACARLCGADGLCMMGQCVDPCDGVDCSDGNECTADLCNVGVCSNPNVGPGAECDQDGGTVCDGAGSCVECNTDNECDVEFGETCVDNVCVASATACNGGDAADPDRADRLHQWRDHGAVALPEPVERSRSTSRSLAASRSRRMRAASAHSRSSSSTRRRAPCPGGVRSAVVEGFNATVQAHAAQPGPSCSRPIRSGITPGLTRSVTYPFEQVCTPNSDCLVPPCKAPVLVAECAPLGRLRLLVDSARAWAKALPTVATAQCNITARRRSASAGDLLGSAVRTGWPRGRSPLALGRRRHVRLGGGPDHGHRSGRQSALREQRRYDCPDGALILPAVDLRRRRSPTPRRSASTAFV